MNQILICLIIFKLQMIYLQHISTYLKCSTNFRLIIMCYYKIINLNKIITPRCIKIKEGLIIIKAVVIFCVTYSKLYIT